MHILLVVVLSGLLLAGAAGGLVAVVPLLRAIGEAAVPVERAPTPELERSRLAVLTSLRAASDGVAEQAARLELLADLMAEAGRPGRDPARHR